MKKILIINLLFITSFAVHSQKIVNPYFSIETAFNEGSILVKYIATEELTHVLFVIENRKLDSTNLFIDKGMHEGLCFWSPSIEVNKKVSFSLSARENNFIIVPQKGDMCVYKGLTECRHIMDLRKANGFYTSYEHTNIIEKDEYNKLMEHFSLDPNKTTIEKKIGSDGGYILIKRWYNSHGVKRREFVFDSVKVNELYKNLTHNWVDECVNELESHEFKVIEDENGNIKMVSTELPEIYILDGITINDNIEQNYSSLLLNLKLESSIYIEYLIKKGANIDEKDNNNNTALILALRNNRPENAKLLIKKGADINTKNNDNWTPLTYALRLYQPENAKLLIEKGANINAKSNNNFTPLMMALSYGQRENAKLLIEKGADINTKNNDNWTPLICALRFNQSDNAKLLIEKGANVNARSNSGYTPLMMALRFNQPENAKLLIEKGADINVMNNDKVTPLMYASSFSQKENVRLLIEKGANVNARNHSNWTPLFYALLTLQYENAKLLIDKGADINVMNNDNETPLMYACKNSTYDLIILMLSQEQKIKKGKLYKKLEENIIINEEEKEQIKGFIVQK